MKMTRRTFCELGAAASMAGAAGLAAHADSSPASSILDAESQFRRFKFWSNRDWDWYAANLPLWESPHPQIDEIYYYRAEVLTKHLRYASPETGYIFTEFSNADRLEWAGRYNAIASAADLHLEEIRWLKTRQYGRDYARYWMKTRGAQPRNYGFPIAWSTSQMGMVQGDQSLALNLLDEYVANYEGWERGWVDYPHDNGFDRERQMFWNTGRDMGGEFNLASCQLSEPLRGIVGYKIRGGAGYRPDINAVLFGEAQTISALAQRAGRDDVAKHFAGKAAALQHNVRTYLWDDEREFFLHRWRYDEYSEGDVAGKKSIQSWSKIWETNADRNGGIGYQPQFVGKGHGRELTGYIPWRFGLPADNERTASAWKFLTSKEHFYAPYGPTTAEQQDPWFHVVYRACRHNGQSWPFHTSRILTAAARLLNDYQHHGGFTRENYFDLFEIYTRTHYQNGVPHLAEAHHPFEPVWVQNEWPGLDYFHSSYIDHVITGLAGLRPSEGNTLVVQPQAPHTWDYFAIDRIAYRGHELSILWDRTGERYKRGRGLMLLVDGVIAARSAQMDRLTATLRPASPQTQPYEVIPSANCDDTEYPKATASFTAKYNSPKAALNGLYWYTPEYGEKWTCRGSWTAEDWFQIEFEAETAIEAVRLFFYADEAEVAAPDSYTVLYEAHEKLLPVAILQTHPRQAEVGRANTVCFVPVTTRKLRVVFQHKQGIGVGLSQIQALATGSTAARTEAGLALPNSPHQTQPGP